MIWSVVLLCFWGPTWRLIFYLRAQISAILKRKGSLSWQKGRRGWNLYPIRTYWESDWEVLTAAGVVGLSLYEFGTDRGVGSWNVMEQEPVVYNNPPCVSWSAYFQVLSPSNNSIHTSPAHGVWCILAFRYQLSGVSKLFQRSLLLIITITCSKFVLWKMLPRPCRQNFWCSDFLLYGSIW